MGGTYRYLGSTLPFPVRMMARLVGFGANRQQGLDLIRQAAEAGGEIGSEAQFGLVLLYNREGRFGAAQRVLRTLRRQYPRNRLLWLETDATALRDDRPALAAARLSEGFDRMKTAKRALALPAWRHLAGARSRWSSPGRSADGARVRRSALGAGAHASGTW